MRLSEAITVYLTERGPEMRPTTLSKYRATLNGLQTTDNGFPFHAVELGSITTTDLRAYRDDLLSRGIKPQSVNKYMDRVRSFFQYMTERGDIPRNPATPIKGLDELLPVRVRFELSTLRQMLDAAESPRDRAMIACSLEWLSRGGELSGIRVGDLDFQRGVCRVEVEKKKGQFREDYLPMGPDLVREVRNWLEVYRRIAVVGPDALLFPAFDTRFTGQGIAAAIRPASRIQHPYRVVKAALAAIGEDTEHAGFHAIRRSMARIRYEALVEDGHADPLGVVKSLLHHESRTQTEIYIGVTAERTLRDRAMRGSTWANTSALAGDAKPGTPRLSVV